MSEAIDQITSIFERNKDQAYAMWRYLKSEDSKEFADLALYIYNKFVGLTYSNKSKLLAGVTENDNPVKLFADIFKAIENFKEDKMEAQRSEYEQMVFDLFKKDVDNTVMAIHAAIGIAGESGELRAATGWTNAQEELGDMEFYRVALLQRLSPVSTNHSLLTEVTSSLYFKPNHATVVDNIHIISCEILDLLKKSWVYGREIKEFEIHTQLILLEINMVYYAEGMLASRMEDVRNKNMHKLLKGKNARYASGTYSDQQALARADKA